MLDFETKTERKIKTIKLLLANKELWLKLTLAEARRAWPRSIQHRVNLRILPVLPVLREIRELNTSLSEKIDLNSAQLQTSINGMKATLDNVLTRVTEAENRISDTEDAVSEIKQLTKQLKNNNELLKRKINQLENHSRRNNVRVVGLKEGTEGTDPVKFFRVDTGGSGGQRLRRSSAAAGNLN